ncbi:uncharacterized protein LOC124172632 [Ischnura elegans]|uniref:uncharacterized protein LOC124172632 n=1 Tax=Ischnura elegans TaxID=197161 RepID=UPI001ED8A9DD|nr:uncharacterized protein LOC124172632 [Ischnura elegans]
MFNLGSFFGFSRSEQPLPPTSDAVEGRDPRTSAHVPEPGKTLGEEDSGECSREPNSEQAQCEMATMDRARGFASMDENIKYRLLSEVYDDDMVSLIKQRDTMIAKSDSQTSSTPFRMDNSTRVASEDEEMKYRALSLVYDDDMVSLIKQRDTMIAKRDSQTSSTPFRMDNSTRGASEDEEMKYRALSLVYDDDMVSLIKQRDKMIADSESQNSNTPFKMDNSTRVASEDEDMKYRVLSLVYDDDMVSLIKQRDKMIADRESQTSNTTVETHTRTMIGERSFRAVAGRNSALVPSTVVPIVTSSDRKSYEDGTYVNVEKEGRIERGTCDSDRTSNLREVSDTPCADSTGAPRESSGPCAPDGSEFQADVDCNGDTEDKERKLDQYKCPEERVLVSEETSGSDESVMLQEGGEKNGSVEPRGTSGSGAGAPSFVPQLLVSESDQAPCPRSPGDRSAVATEICQQNSSTRSGTVKQGTESNDWDRIGDGKFLPGGGLAESVLEEYSLSFGSLEEEVVAAIKSKHLEECEDLLGRLEGSNLIEKSGRTLLHLAVEQGKLDWSERLLLMASNPNDAGRKVLALGEDMCKKFPLEPERETILRLVRLASKFGGSDDSVVRPGAEANRVPVSRRNEPRGCAFCVGHESTSAGSNGRTSGSGDDGGIVGGSGKTVLPSFSVVNIEGKIDPTSFSSSGGVINRLEGNADVCCRGVDSDDIPVEGNTPESIASDNILLPTTLSGYPKRRVGDNEDTSRVKRSPGGRDLNSLITFLDENLKVSNDHVEVNDSRDKDRPDRGQDFDGSGEDSTARSPGGNDAVTAARGDSGGVSASCCEESRSSVFPRGGHSSSCHEVSESLTREVNSFRSSVDERLEGLTSMLIELCQKVDFLSTETALLKEDTETLIDNASIRGSAVSELRTEVDEMKTELLSRLQLVFNAEPLARNNDSRVQLRAVEESGNSVTEAIAQKNSLYHPQGCSLTPRPADSNISRSERVRDHEKVRKDSAAGTEMSFYTYLANEMNDPSSKTEYDEAETKPRPLSGTVELKSFDDLIKDSGASGGLENENSDKMSEGKKREKRRFSTDRYLISKRNYKEALLRAQNSISPSNVEGGFGSQPGVIYQGDVMVQQSLPRSETEGEPKSNGFDDRIHVEYDGYDLHETLPRTFDSLASSLANEMNVPSSNAEFDEVERKPRPSSGTVVLKSFDDLIKYSGASGGLENETLDEPSEGKRRGKKGFSTDRYFISKRNYKEALLRAQNSISASGAEDGRSSQPTVIYQEDVMVQHPLSGSETEGGRGFNAFDDRTRVELSGCELHETLPRTYDSLESSLVNEMPESRSKTFVDQFERTPDPLSGIVAFLNNGAMVVYDRASILAKINAEASRSKSEVDFQGCSTPSTGIAKAKKKGEPSHDLKASTLAKINAEASSSKSEVNVQRCSTPSTRIGKAEKKGEPSRDLKLRDACVNGLLTITNYTGTAKCRKLITSYYQEIYSSGPITSTMLDYLCSLEHTKIIVDFQNVHIGHMKPTVRDIDGGQSEGVHHRVHSHCSRRTVYVAAKMDHFTKTEGVMAWLTIGIARMSMYAAFRNKAKPYDKRDKEKEAEFGEIVREAEEMLHRLGPDYCNYYIRNALEWKQQAGKDIAMISAVPGIIAHHGHAEGIRILNEQVPSLLKFYQEEVMSKFLLEVEA